MPGATSVMQQFFCPSKPTFTEKDLPNLKNKVIIVTGSNTGLGKEIARMVYSKNAKVYMMARSEEKTQEAIKDIETSLPNSDGELHFIRLDLSDLTSIKQSVDEFLSREHELHLLFNNAGVGYPEKGSKTKQGYELQIGVNCLGPFGFTNFLAPTLVSTAKTSPRGSVRVIWVSSSASEAFSPKGLMEILPKIEEAGEMDKYSISKLGNYLHATEFAARYKAEGVVSIPLNPGALDSDFWRTQGGITTAILRKTVLHPPIYGAYTNIFAAFSPEITLERSGSYIAPWGQFWQVSKDMLDAAKTEVDGGTGIARSFWDWSQAQWDGLSA
ncbi:short-chain alcohol dehydrogenase [Gnomoniopsis smithogilvyi]|uniref:Short-chain alcohol dehydrogenase n=1 Tax=Gnomoniopsis smithogilvyi TaxID=1191159 RepID=A0A9W9CTK6_9PEZI|nr:short-chain alcohol dehydrogenase [Gnomoniopsis smithogilvyi]